MRTAARHAIEIERRIQASPETVFAYFTDPERYRMWQGMEAELDPRPGGVFRVRMTGRSGTVVRGEYVEVEPPRRLVFTWGWERMDQLPEGMADVPPGTSMVEVDLVPDGEGTVLRLRHSGLPSDVAHAFHGNGWDASLVRLVAAAEGRDPGPNPFAEA